MGRTVIIGGGAIGLACAHYLSELGEAVVLLEKGRLGSGCSSGNAGLLVPSHIVPLPSPGVIGNGLRWLVDKHGPFGIRSRLDGALFRWLWQFRAHCTSAHVNRAMPLLHAVIGESMTCFQSLEARHGLTITRRGLLMVYRSAKGERACLEHADQARAFGMPVHILDRAGLEALEPGFRGEASGAVHFEEDAHLDPEHLLAILTRLARAQGAELIENEEVVSLDKRDEKVVSVTTQKATYEAEHVVLAGGAWSPGLARMLGFRLPVEAGKGYSTTYPAQPGLPEIPIIQAEDKVTITPMGDRVRFSGTLELSGLDGSINRARTARIADQVESYLPGTRPVASTDFWSGFRPCTPDGLPIIERLAGTSNLIAATGHAMIGITLAPYTGKRVAGLIRAGLL